MTDSDQKARDRKEALDALKIDHGAQEPAAGRGGRVSGLVAVVVVLIGGGVAAWAFLTPKAVAVEVATVEVTGGPTTGVAGSVLNASGYVVAELAATVSSQITGMIKKVFVTAGMEVEKGQVLAYLHDKRQQAAVNTARSRLAVDRAAVAKAKARLAHDQLVLQRKQRLLAQKLASQSSVDQAQAALNVDRAALHQAKAQVVVDQNRLQTAKINLGYTVIRAPFSGVVTEKYAHPGEMISPAAVGGFTKTGVCRLVDMGSLEIDVDVNEAFIQRVSEGMRVEAVLDAYPDWRIPAHVISVVPTANRQKATVRVRIAFDQLDPRILPQMGVQVWFYDDAQKTPKQAPATVLAPADAVHGGGTEHYVFLVANGRAKRQPVTVGPTQNNKVTVLSGLSGGEQVIVSSPKSLHDGEQVMIRT